MRCVICKVGDVDVGTTTVAMERSGATVVIKGVPARVCANCGEEYLDERIAKTLLQEAEDALSRGVEVDVRHYVAA
jgi:YgiT-type zinc finger domain-containing protein